jgi:hypothetical protein
MFILEFEPNDEPPYDAAVMCCPRAWEKVGGFANACIEM